MISVVIASARSPELLRESLARLLPQARAVGAEVVVARRAVLPGMPPEVALPEGCRLVTAPPKADIPALRGAGLAEARGEWVALTEDNCVPDPGWLAALQQEFSSGVSVLGGVMGNHRTGRSINAGATYAEYGFFGPWQPAAIEGRAPLVTGANVAYHRSVVADVARWAINGDWEDVIHARLAERGARFRLVADALVEQNLDYRLAAFCSDRYRHGRDYARVRSQQLSPARRLALAMLTPLLPFVLARRIWQSSGRGAPAVFLRALPWTLTFLTAWAIGEWVGYISGPSRHA